jgi:hypothetical protein
MRPARRLIKTELALPSSTAGRAAVFAALFVGGMVAIAMVSLFVAFLVETFRTAR